jgi:alpha-beta hydrolase superfamily lysophospholipase
MDLNDVNWSGERDGEIFTLTVDGQCLSGCHWKPQSPPIFVYLFSHGLCSSVEFNASLLREIPNHGGASLAVDHVGNGYSEGFRGSQTIPDMVQEAQALIRYARSLYPSTAIFLVGHSMGGLAVASFAIRAPPELSELAGIILLAPWLSTRPGRLPGTFATYVCRALSWLFPTITGDTGITPTNNSYPDAYKALVQGSPRFHPRATVGLLASVVTEMAEVGANWARFPNIPVLYIQAMDDNCVQPEVNLQFGQRLVSSGTQLSRLIVFDEGTHDVVKSHARKEALQAEFSFISDVIKQ